MAKLSKKINLDVTLITNGSIILKKSQDDVNDLLQYFDSVGISMDSISDNINQESGWTIDNRNSLSEKEYLEIAKKIKKAGCSLKSKAK
ncbi:hypothetical protein [Spiroplasma endosymbiont of Dioctria linearis]|uniref:hypothetical protein n=1 Tax=Spiroplasma endosymbiont of Dioctria linearis TaxID=3066290 RepID=UPI00313EFA12